MPLDEEVRYRVKSMPNGQKVRLAFSTETNEVVEAKALSPKPLKYKAKQRRKRKYST